MNDGMNVGVMDVTATNIRITTVIKKILNYMYLLLKELFDVVFSLIGIVMLLPLSVIVKITYMLSGDFNTIFYHQIRIGKDGKEFKLFKFRTMVPNADKLLDEILKNDPKLKKEWDENQKLSNDPRITKMGKILRKTSLDETPQFVNVLYNEMSFIGPRPLVPNELKKHHGNKEIYEQVKPGITSWWACNGRSDLKYSDRLDLEYFYVNNRSLKLDIKCIVKTITSVINKKGAK